MAPRGKKLFPQYSERRNCLHTALEVLLKYNNVFVDCMLPLHRNIALVELQDSSITALVV